MSEKAEVPREKLISITRIHLKDPSVLQEFLRHTLASLTQTRGMVGRKGLLERPKVKEEDGVFYTLSTWSSEEAMEAFKNQGGHKIAMDSHLGETESYHWYSNQTPNWEAAIKKLDEEVERRKKLTPQK